MAPSPYPYSSLNTATNEIRLLSLAPGALSSPIHCHINHANLGSRLEYTALSYTWGDLSNRKPITINDQYTLHITTNLRDALLHLRHRTKIQTFWIDAVCINQDDISERNRQVPRMRDIYANATKVEVWLGRASAVDRRALSLVAQIGQSIVDPEEFLAKGGSPAFKERFWDLLENFSSETVRSLNDVFNRPWWGRVWVVQELSVAKQLAASVACGDVSVPWLAVLVTAYAIEACWGILNQILWRKFPDVALDGFNNGIRMSQCRYVHESQPRYRLLELLNQHRDCAATDPRDHIYGLLGMSGDADEIGLEVDYKKPVQHIYTDLVMKHIAATKSLNIICACRGERKVKNLSTWVPDWSTDQVVSGLCIHERFCGGDLFPGSPSSHIQKYKTAGLSEAEVAFSPSKTEMITKGLVLGKVVDLAPVDGGLMFENVEAFGVAGPDGKSNSGSEVFDEWLNLILEDENYQLLERIYGDQVLHAFSRTLVANRNNRMTIPELQEDNHESEDESMSYDSRDNGEEPDVKAQGKETSNQVANADNDENIEFEADTTQIFSPIEYLSMSPEEFKSCIQVSWGKRLAVLDTGYLGIVPHHCQEGDHAYVLPGCDLPVILRRSGRSGLRSHTGKSKHILVGESYFHGVAEGEIAGAIDWKIDENTDDGVERLVLV